MIRLFINGTVLTMDPTNPVAEAFAVRDGRMVEVGSTDEVLWRTASRRRMSSGAGPSSPDGCSLPRNFRVSLCRCEEL